MKFINKEELLESIKRRYEDLENDCGCNVSTSDSYKWLSIARIVEIINACDEYEED